jgi:hypothetical protein
MAVSSINTLSAVEQAVRTASQSTGVDFGYLMRTARRESGMNASAHATTSSAAGLFQFVEQTWLSTMKQHGTAHGYARYSDLIQMGSDGRYHVPSGEDARKAVMDLRLDPHCAAIMAGELASDSAAYLRGRVGREPTGGELYAAHFLGPQGSAKLIEAVQSSPNGVAASLFHDAAAANHGVFYRDGRALTVSEVYANLNHTGGGDAAAAINADPGQDAFVSYASAGRTERMREQDMLVKFIMDDGNDKGPATSMFSADLLSILSNARQAQAKGE